MSLHNSFFNCVAKLADVSVTNQPNANVNDWRRVAETRIELSTLDNLKVVVGSLFEEHYEEIALNKKVMKLKPD